MSCTSAYADADDFAEFWCASITDEERTGINRILELSATMIHAARDATNGCDCTLADWASNYLMTLNCMLAVTVYNCRCTNLNLTQEEKQMYLTAAREDLVNIRQGNIELCADATGAEFPATSWAAQGLNEFSKARIVVNDILRNS